MAMTRRGFFGALAGLAAAVASLPPRVASLGPPALALPPSPKPQGDWRTQTTALMADNSMISLEAAEPIDAGDLLVLTKDGRARRYKYGIDKGNRPFGRAISYKEWLDR